MQMEAMDNYYLPLPKSKPMQDNCRIPEIEIFAWWEVENAFKAAIKTLEDRKAFAPTPEQIEWYNAQIAALESKGVEIETMLIKFANERPA